ncbi:putative lipoprotein [Bacteriovorax sp. BAL6_X]|uniref:lipoprotein n=1 Tax=Bacteriovorax sp. BAL6_X TaxID=1201290 RepID=UPI0003866500|nr:lipoprotein [Bacteriovorax sp. BAL6_X]EPZ51690.1 putative lipoprotein [Bacteriovorax sp. BAL6_X]
MNKFFIISFSILLCACGGQKKFLGQEQGSIYSSEILKRNPSDGKEVTLKARIHKKLKNNFYLVKDEQGLILVKIRSSLLGLDSDYNYQTLFLMKGETDNESKHFYVEIEELELFKP